MKFPLCLSAAALYFSVLSSTIFAQSPDLFSGFESDAENWTANDAGTTLTWQAAGGAEGAYLEGEGNGNSWSFVSPPTWSGDWSEYRSFSFELAIPTRDYPDDDRADMVVIVGANAQTMVWNAPTPVWSWTPYAISLDPASFGVDSATFDAIMANVAEIRILGEFTTASETVGLDNVLLSSTPVTVFSENLIERFTNASVDPVNNSVNGWAPVDDVTFSVNEEGRPSYSLFCNDWQDGRLYKIASPASWSGDWTGFSELSFDMRWNSSGSTLEDATVVTIFGANGQTLTWQTDLTDNLWQRHTLPLEPSSFGVDQSTFDAVMSFVNRIWIHGEFNDGDDLTNLDNIALTTQPLVAPLIDFNLFSRFTSDTEGWTAIDECAIGWLPSGGRFGGYITGEDTGSGIAKLQSPDSWSGDWSQVSELRFFIKTTGNAPAQYNATVWITDFKGGIMSYDCPGPYNSWSPITLALTAENFGVSQIEFDAIMSDAAHLWIRTDLINGTGATDTSGLDEVALLQTADVILSPPPPSSTFDSGAEGWRGNGRSGSSWSFSQTEADFSGEEGDPSGSVTLADVSDLAGWMSPEAWSGDWRAYDSVSFDLKILQGTNLLSPGWAIAIISPQGVLLQEIAQVPQLGIWNSYQFDLSAAAFGVSEAEFALIMRDVTALCIRSEWISGSELEALDNVVLSSGNNAYYTWISGYLSSTELQDPNISGTEADADLDGGSNWEEYLALTIPNDPTSFFHATPLHTVDGFTVEYDSQHNRLYQVWRSTTLQNDWAPVGPQVIGDGTVRSYEDTSGAPEAFFKVEVLLAP